MRSLALILALSACDGGGDSSQPRIDDLAAGMRAMNRAIGLSSAFLGLGVVDPNADAMTIALAIYQHFKAQTGTCAMATPTDATVSADLGAGCTLATAGFVAGGTTTVTVNKMATPLNIHFDNLLKVGGDSITGTFEANAGSGSSFDYGTKATLAGATLSLPFFSAGIASGGVQVTGMGTLTGKNTSMVTVSAVHQRFDRCHPDEGSVRLQDTGVDVTVTFSGATPTTGQVNVTENGVGRTLTLPACH